MRTAGKGQIVQVFGNDNTEKYLNRRLYDARAHALSRRSVGTWLVRPPHAVLK
jgi:hypothetical protein